MISFIVKNPKLPLFHFVETEIFITAAVKLLVHYFDTILGQRFFHFTSEDRGLVCKQLLHYSVYFSLRVKDLI